MKSLSAPVLAALAGDRVALVQLVRIAFPSGTQALNSSNYDFAWDGITYKGAYGLGSATGVTDRPGELQGVRFDLAAGDAASISLALDDADEVQGSPVIIRTAIVDKDSLAILDAPLEWTGACDTMALGEDGEHAVVSVTAENKGVDLLRGNPLTYSDADQQSLYAGDLAFQYAASQQDKKDVWPSREWFFK